MTSSWDSVLEEALTVESKQPGPVCAVKRLLDSLDEKDRFSLALALDSGASSPALARAITNRVGNLAGITHQNIARHRRGDCRCGK